MRRATLTEGTLIGGRYRVAATLGSGTMGTVYRATRISDGLPVAVKLISKDPHSSELARRVAREAQALAALEHPHALAVIELGEDAHGTFLVTKLAPGVSLDAILSARRLPPELALMIADQVLAALEHAHGLGILHRDVKPGNVIVAFQPDGRPHARLIDFGLAKFQNHEVWGAQSMITSQGAIVGTPAYIAPEQLFGPFVDARSDVYSAGVLLFELLTGSWPFVAEEVADVLRAHALAPVPSLGETRPDVSFHPKLEALVARALAKKMDARFENAGKLRDALRSVPHPAATGPHQSRP
jgi:serine/threonine-protein kinase